MIHTEALRIFGLKGRLAKLRMEATELSNCVDRIEEGKASMDDLLHEMRDLMYVWESISRSNEYKLARRTHPIDKHEVYAEGKLKQAIRDRQASLGEIDISSMVGDADA